MDVSVILSRCTPHSHPSYQSQIVIHSHSFVRSFTSPAEMKSFPRSCRVARAWAVALPETVDTSFPGLKPPMLDMSGDKRLGVLRVHQTGWGWGGEVLTNNTTSQ